MSLKLKEILELPNHPIIKAVREGKKVYCTEPYTPEKKIYLDVNSNIHVEHLLQYPERYHIEPEIFYVILEKYSMRLMADSPDKASIEEVKRLKYNEDHFVIGKLELL